MYHMFVAISLSNANIGENPLPRKRKDPAHSVNEKITRIEPTPSTFLCVDMCIYTSK